MLLSVLANIISIWSLSNWKYHVKTGLVTEGKRMRLDLELMAMIAIGSFLLGMLLMVLAVVG
jgi:hypothetical protein